MLKSKVRRGFTLLEASISVSLVIILVTCAFKIEYRVIRLREFNYKAEDSINLIKLTVDNIIENSTYEQLKSLITINPWIINSENINFDTLKLQHLTNVMENSISNDNEYIRLYITGDDVITVKGELVINMQGKAEKFNYEGFKGCY